MNIRRFLALVCASAAIGAGCSRRIPGQVLRVCADPNNLPFSNRAGEGFENRIAELLAEDRRATLDYSWWAQRRGFVRNTLTAGTCDIVIGVPAAFKPTSTTRPYYRSSYVFVSRRDRRLGLHAIDDPRLRELRIGVQMIGDDFNNSPPAHALSNRGLVRNVVGYSVFGDYAQPGPLSPIISAVDRGDVDAAIVWGPTAGYFARTAAHQLELVAITPHGDSASLPFVFDMAMGLRPGDARLHDELDDFITRRRADIDRILADYGVPRVEGD
jgi:quinoprotein dehydrogenase-associated probable ABC transporter substrate-binding protein